VRGLVGNSPRAMTPPWCAVCDKRCDRVDQEYDSFMRRVVFTAVCHGERERVVLTEAELNVLEGRVAIAAGIAFDSTRARLLK
jgi:hypothetical protein